MGLLRLAQISLTALVSSWLVSNSSKTWRAYSHGRGSFTLPSHPQQSMITNNPSLGLCLFRHEEGLPAAGGHVFLVTPNSITTLYSIHCKSPSGSPPIQVSEQPLWATLQITTVRDPAQSPKPLWLPRTMHYIPSVQWRLSAHYNTGFITTGLFAGLPPWFLML